MQRLLKIFFSPLVFALGFLWPLCAQIIIAADWVSAPATAYAIGAAIAIGWGLLAQLRGSWIWIK